MSVNGTTSAPPEVVRRLDDPAALALAGVVETFDDLQTVLRCCERLVSDLAEPAEPDAVGIEAIWTTALLSYARCFGADGAGGVLSEDDVATTHDNSEEVRKWHRLLLSLRDHYADRCVNPRERFSVAVTQDLDGAASGVAITSARQPLVDDLTVRQTGAIAYALSGVVNARIEAAQQRVFSDVQNRSVEELNALEVLEVTADTDGVG
ncbi:MAG TPA: hypothetical protein VIT41_04345 [Microlunatus sp.]